MAIERRAVTWVAVFVLGAFTPPAISIVSAYGFAPRLLFTGLGLTMVLFAAFAVPMVVVYWALKLWGRFNETHFGALVNTVLSATIIVIIVAAVFDAFRATFEPAWVMGIVAGDRFVNTVAPWIGVAIVMWTAVAFVSGICVPIVQQIVGAFVPQASREAEQEENDR